jgi:hypothetical protein
LIKVIDQVSAFIDTIGQKPPRSKSRKPPLAELKAAQLAAVARCARKFPWKDRGDDPRNPIEWTKDHYGRWIPGLLRTQLFEFDRGLYSALQCRMRRPGYPDWLDLPTESENRDRIIAHSPKQLAANRSRRLLSRRLHKVQVALRCLDRA